MLKKRWDYLWGRGVHKGIYRQRIMVFLKPRLSTKFLCDVSQNKKNKRQTGEFLDYN